MDFRETKHQQETTTNLPKPPITTRQIILETAQKHFMRDGYKATSTRHIAKEVGITQPNLYHHFANKEALYVAVLEMVAKNAMDDLKLIPAENDHQLEASLIKMTYYLRDTHPYNFPLMMNDMKKEISPESSFALYRIFQTSYLQPFIDLFERNADQMIEHFEANLIASHFFLVISPYMNPDNLSYSQLSIESIIDFFLNGIRR